MAFRTGLRIEIRLVFSKFWTEGVRKGVEFETETAIGFAENILKGGRGGGREGMRDEERERREDDRIEEEEE